MIIPKKDCEMIGILCMRKNGTICTNENRVMKICMKMWIVASDIIEGERIKYAFFERQRGQYRAAAGT